jgi:hypothetical protein
MASREENEPIQNTKANHLQRAWPGVTLRPMQRDDALSNLKLARIGTHGRYHASEFMAEDCGLFNERESALAVEDIAECNGASRNFYEDFASFGEHHRHVAELKGLR